MDCWASSIGWWRKSRRAIAARTPKRTYSDLFGCMKSHLEVVKDSNVPDVSMSRSKVAVWFRWTCELEPCRRPGPCRAVDFDTSPSSVLCVSISSDGCTAINSLKKRVCRHCSRQRVVMDRAFACRREVVPVPLQRSGECSSSSIFQSRSPAILLHEVRLAPRAQTCGECCRCALFAAGGRTLHVTFRGTSQMQVVYNT